LSTQNRYAKFPATTNGKIDAINRNFHSAIEYSYQVEDKKHTGKKFFVLVDAFVHDPGEVVTVHYNPEFPSRSRLELSHSFDALIYALVLIIFVGFGIHFYQTGVKEIDSV
jgi:hypothetical protein